MKKNIKIYMWFAAVFFSVMLCSCSNKSKRTPAWKNTTCLIYDTDNGIKASWISYTIDGKVYEQRIDGWYSNTIIGEKYILHYNPNNPDDFEIDFWHQIFEPGESTHFFRGKVKTVRKKSFFQTVPEITYTYKVNDDKIEKWIRLPDNYLQLYPNLQEGQYYNVQVWDENIYRAVLRLDLPIQSKPGGKIFDRSVPIK